MNNNPDFGFGAKPDAELQALQARYPRFLITRDYDGRLLARLITYIEAHDAASLASQLDCVEALYGRPR